MSLIYVCGSGPSGKDCKKAHVVTKKKLKVDYEHIVLPRANWITQQTKHKAIAWPFYPRQQYWEDYYAKFKPRKYKPSNGLQAVFVAIDLYDADELCLLGFDNVLNGAKPTQHDWQAELKCIESLVRIVGQ